MLLVWASKLTGKDNEMNLRHKCFLVFFTIIVLAFVLLCNLNRILLHQMMNKLENVVMADFYIIDKASVYGKLNGNGNGIQFFGAVLVEGESEESISTIVADLSGQYEEVGYAKQHNSEIKVKYLEHRTLQFSFSSFLENKQYYIIYFFNSQNPYSWPFDLAGH